MAAKKSVKKPVKKAVKKAVKKSTKEELEKQLASTEKSLASLKKISDTNAQVLIEQTKYVETLEDTNQALQAALVDEQAKTAKALDQVQVEFQVNHLLDTAVKLAIKSIDNLKAKVEDLEQDNHHKQIQIDALNDKVLDTQKKFSQFAVKNNYLGYHPPLDYPTDGIAGKTAGTGFYSLNVGN